MKIYLLIGISLSLLFYYFGFINKDRLEFVDLRIKSAFFIFLILTGIIGYVVWQESVVKNEIAKFIIPYPKITKSTFVPSIPGGNEKYWIVFTPDTAKEISDFYLQERNHPGWKINSKNPLFFQQNDLQLSLSCTEKSKGTEIVYSLFKKE